MTIELKTLKELRMMKDQMLRELRKCHQSLLKDGKQIEMSVKQKATCLRVSLGEWNLNVEGTIEPFNFYLIYFQKI